MKLAVMFTAVIFPVAAFAFPGGMWVGDQKKDPITDRPFTLAMTFQNNTQINITLRCRNGEIDLFVDPDEALFRTGEKKQITIRFDQSPAFTVNAVAVEPTLLAIEHNRESNILTPFLRAKSIAVRFTDARARQNTFTFQSSLLPNSLTKVGRVLADCGFASFPQAEIDQAIADLDKPQKGKQRR